MQDLHCKKYINSGLQSRSPTPLSDAQSQADSFGIGGLCDDDLEESYPIVVENEGPQKRISHGNDVCIVSCLLEMLTSIPTSL